jgi:hypothetical protein
LTLVLGLCPEQIDGARPPTPLEGMSMSDPKHSDKWQDFPVAGRAIPGLPNDIGFGATAGAQLPSAIDFELRPDKPSPEDDWKIPTGPIEDLKPEPVREPVHSGGLLHRLTHRG